MSTQSNQRPLIQSVSRAAAILKCFNNDSELGITEISRLVGLHKSTTAGIINTLKAENLLEQDTVTGKYRLGLEFFSLASQTRRDLREIAEPYLRNLLESTNETVNLGVLTQNEIMYLAKIESTHSIRITSSVGARLPVFCTAIGKAILAFLPESETESIIDSISFVPYTDKTITDKEALLSALDEIRKTGIAFDLEEYERDVICIAAPLLYHNGRSAGAISVSGPSSRMTKTNCQKIICTLKDVAEKVCAELVRLS